MRKEMRAIFVSKETHKKFKLKAVEVGMTFDEFLNILMETTTLRTAILSKRDEDQS